MVEDFSGYATKHNLKCSDGRTIMPDAFAHNDGMTVPLVWQHGHGDPENVLGHATLENRDDGVYAYGYFNATPAGKNAKTLVQHGDITALSIYANQLVERSKNVIHGAIREVSLVLSGANPGALIDNVNLRHSDGDVEVLDDEAVIYTGLTLSHAEKTVTQTPKDSDAGSETKESNMAEKTVKDVFDEMSEEQKNVVYFMIGTALEEAGADTDDTDNGEAAQFDGSPFITHQEAFEMTRNVFEMAGAENGAETGSALSHSDVEAIVKDAQRVGSLKEAVLAHAGTYGIDNIDLLFPDAKSITNTPDFISRRTEWVQSVLAGTKHSPFSRIKTVHADITADEARAKGYVKGNLKKEEVIKLLRRKTSPTTIYKKQKLDRDDVLDITDLDVIAWIKGEMRLMLDEEIARAVLIGDGRSEIDEDKIDEEAIRPIAKDDAMYAHPIELPSNAGIKDTIEALIRGRGNYKGTGQPVFYTTLPFLTDMLLHTDALGRRMYDTVDALASALMVAKIVPVEVMESESEVVGIMVNLNDYTIGADKGGEIGMFDDFDIDYNQHKYLIETRISGALTKPKSAVVIKRAAGISVTPTSPSFDSETNTITVPAIDGVVYSIEGIPVTGTEVIASTTQVDAAPDEGYSFPAGSVTNWTFVYTAA